MSGKAPKFNFLDVLIILAALSLVAGIIWREELTDRIESKNMEDTVTVVCGINAFASAAGDDQKVKFDEGQTVVYIGGTEVGYIVTVKTAASEESDTDSAQPVTEETKLYLKAVSRESGYYIGGEEKLLIGGKYLMHTKTMEFTVQILSADEAKTK